MVSQQQIYFVNSKGEQQSFNTSFIYLKSVSGFSGVGSETATYNTYNYDGVKSEKTQLNARDMSIYFLIKADNVQQYLNIRKEITKICNPKLGLGTLYYNYGEHKLKIPMRVSQAPIFEDIKSNKTYCTGEVTLQSDEAYLQSIEELTGKTGYDTPMWTFPFTIPPEGMMFDEVVNSKFLVIDNKGNAETGIQISLEIKTDNTSNISIENQTNEQTLRLTGTYEVGDKILINTNLDAISFFLVRNGVTTDILDDFELTSDLITLETGINSFFIDSNQDENAIGVTFTAIEKFVGI